MPPKAKTVEPETEAVTLGAPPAHASELCPEHGAAIALHPSSTTFVCEHGAWTFTPAAEVAVPAPSEEEKRAAALALLGLTEDQFAALNAPPA